MTVRKDEGRLSERNGEVIHYEFDAIHFGGNQKHTQHKATRNFSTKVLIYDKRSPMYYIIDKRNILVEGSHDGLAAEKEDGPSS